MAHSWKDTEHTLLVVFLCARLWNFWQRLGTPIGFDISRHLYMVERINFFNTSLDNHSMVYAYHPPLGFMLPNWLIQLGFSSLVSVQIVSLMASLVAFFALRALLRRLSLLESPAGLAWLYGLVSLPVLVHMSTSVNLDIIIFACFCLVLLLAVLLCTSTKQIGLMLAIVSTLSCALLTKFSGALLLAVPVIVGLFWQVNYRQMATIITVSVLSAAVVFPYYYREYKVPEGSFFPTNTEWFVPEDLALARQQRDANPVAFLKQLVTPNPLKVDQGPLYRNLSHPSLFDVWRDVWLRNHHLGHSSALAVVLGRWYSLLAMCLALLGLLIVTLKRPQQPWSQLGIVLIALSIIHLTALVYYIYQTPVWGPAKAIYVAPALLGLMYLLVQGAQPFKRVPHHHSILTIILLSFITLNHVVPVY